MIDKIYLNELLTNIGLQPTESQLQQFFLYAQQLVDCNKNVNLTAITDPREVAVKHFCDSVYPLTLVDYPQAASIIDVGAGGGFPSIPTKIIRPDLDFTLLDSLQKRVSFLQEMSQQLALSWRSEHARAEQFARTAARESYDIATSRAVANLALLAELTLPLVKVGGMVVALKGSTAAQEVEQATRAVQLCGGQVEQVIDYKLPNNDPRSLVILRKVSATDDKYPRNSAQISKKTL